MTTSQYIELHHDHNRPPQAKVTFRVNSYDEDGARPWGVLHVDIATGNGNGSTHMTSARHFLHGKDWRQQAAAIRQAFRSATFQP